MLEDTGATSSEVVTDDLSGTPHLVVVADQAFETDGTTAVYFVCGDADLCTETVSETVCKPCGAVPVDARGIYSLQKNVCSLVVFCYDGVRVFGRVSIDMEDSVLYVFDGFDCYVEREELLAEVIFRSRGNLIGVFL